MSGGFNVRPDEHQAAAARFAAAGDELFAAFDDLSSELASVAAMCGDDEHGDAFATAWEPKADELKTAMHDAAKAVAAISERLGAMAAGYIRSEAVNDRSCHSDLGLVP